VLLLLPTATYRAADFLTAARTLGAEVVVASERRLVSMGDAQLTLDLCRPEAAAEAIAALAEDSPLDAVVAVDDSPATRCRPRRRRATRRRCGARSRSPEYRSPSIARSARATTRRRSPPRSGFPAS
jgi:hypothetical protein